MKLNRFKIKLLKNMSNNQKKNKENQTIGKLNHMLLMKHKYSKLNIGSKNNLRIKYINRKFTY